MSKKKFAVFGDPIEHSQSPIIHKSFAKQCGILLSYEKRQVSIDTFTKEVSDFFAKGGLGLNITSPLKELAYQLSDTQKPQAKRAKAANTLWMVQDQLVADNTDGLGLVTDIQHYLSLSNQRIHILGAGGAARSIVQKILENDVQSLSVSNRTPEKALAIKSDFPTLTITPWEDPLPEIDILINATSSQLTTWPSCSNKELKIAYDLAYSQTGLTPFLIHYQKKAKQVLDGMGMLIEQAAFSFERWHHIYPNTNTIRSQLIKNKYPP